MAEEKDLPGGVLSVIDFEEKDMDGIIRYFEKFVPGFPYKIFHELMGTDQFWEFMDVFSGWRLNFPRKNVLLKGITYVKIYNYCKARGFTDESKRRAAQVFRKRLVSVQRIVAYMQKEYENE